MQLYIDGQSYSTGAAIDVAQNHGIDLEDAQYLVKCLENNEMIDYDQYRGLREGMYLKQVAAFVTKVDVGGALVPTVSTGPSGGAVIGLEADIDTDGIVREVIKRGNEIMSEHFNLTEDGDWEINHEAPPTIEEAYQSASAAIKTNEIAQKVEEHSLWTLGNIIAICEEHFGEDYNISQLATACGKGEPYCSRAVRTYRWTRENGKFRLPMTTHDELLSSHARTDEQKKEALEFAEKHQLTQVNARNLNRLLLDGGEISDLEGLSTGEVKTKLKADPKAHNWVFRSGDKVWRRRIPAGEIPVADWAVNLRTGDAYVGNAKRTIYDAGIRKNFQTISVELP